MGIPVRKRLRLPCLGFFLQGSVKALAVGELGLQLALIVVEIVAALRDIDGLVDSYRSSGRVGFAVRITTAVYFNLYKVVSMILAVRLFQAASIRDRQFISLWLLVSAILTAPLVACFVAFSALNLWRQVLILAINVGWFIYKAYSFWTVWCFLKEMDANGAADQALTILSDAELEDFYSGNAAAAGTNGFLAKPYGKDLEIPISRLIIDTSQPLGSGAFGEVYKAEISGIVSCGDYADHGCQVVAVKTVPPTADIAYFKALLKELQILNYIGGRHDNIVNLIGACTSEIKERKLYVVVEFCRFGSILSYLRAHGHQLRTDRKSLPTQFSSEYICPEEENPLQISDLIKWAFETANGMEFIARKNIIHGDLAARNVLLSSNRTAKIADFGLSRQIYRYTTYTKHCVEPIPWKWAAIESLRDLKFSTFSDVWSFGITVWEFFSAGDTPYPGVQYGTEFLEKLGSGQIQPGQPPYADLNIYQKLQQCWSIDPIHRPSFGELKLFFEQLYTDRYQYQEQPACVGGYLAECALKLPNT